MINKTSLRAYEIINANLVDIYYLHDVNLYQCAFPNIYTPMSFACDEA